MEIMGLAVIVILLSLGLFFITRFSITNPSQNQAQSFQQKQLAASFINTLLSTSANCTGPASFTDLIVEMADPESSLLTCPDGGLYQHFNTTVMPLLSQTLDRWNYKYQLDILYPLAAPNGHDVSISGNCTTTSQSESYTQPIPTTDSGTILVKMKICY